jgi:hypothetical protein
MVPLDPLKVALSLKVPPLSPLPELVVANVGEDLGLVTVTTSLEHVLEAALFELSPP